MGERPRRRRDVSRREVDGEIVILDRVTGHVHQLNATASFIWQRCDGEHAAADIARELAGAFPVSAEVAERDVSEALRQLAARGLLEEDSRAEHTAGSM